MTLIKQYEKLVKKGLKNWTDEDFKQSNKIYTELIPVYGIKKTQQLLKNARLKAFGIK
tara:strand:- start:239 stop:412 length:174 start_codon:yes stop_codon:yes gene_type:complete